MHVCDPWLFPDVAMFLAKQHVMRRVEAVYDVKYNVMEGAWADVNRSWGSQIAERYTALSMVSLSSYAEQQNLGRQSIQLHLDLQA